ncbi:hypothetical protein C2S52_003078 [Perilla frutescens var. hirtella]|nr:hypothetical protein C2S51_012391 [Perilla frutescens var. frutescens]KAH6792601.1 hypothetical protein C2S52_003078 [Perilla frutescens var. hirtella]
MTSILASHPPTRLPATGDNFAVIPKPADCRILSFGYSNFETHFRRRMSAVPTRRRTRGSCIVSSGKLEDSVEDDDDSGREDSQESGIDPVSSDILRENLEKIVGADDSSFSGIDLATLIRNKYGKSYDVQLIRKEFMGRNLLALNVMWKYMEQRSFPLTEEEYILRLDDVANTLKCWGAVSHVRSSLQKSKERPRIGKAVSIFIDMDESGGRANEWIYK